MMERPRVSAFWVMVWVFALAYLMVYVLPMLKR